MSKYKKIMNRGGTLRTLWRQERGGSKTKQKGISRAFCKPVNVTVFIETQILACHWE